MSLIHCDASCIIKLTSKLFFLYVDDVTDNAVELGTMHSGPKAGLASMETLDDSTKDPWGPEQNGGSPDPKAPKDEETGTKDEKAAIEEEEKEKLVPIWQACWHNIVNYQWSIGTLSKLNRHDTNFFN